MNDVDELRLTLRLPTPLVDVLRDISASTGESIESLCARALSGLANTWINEPWPEAPPPHSLVLIRGGKASTDE
jgi:hypothetical protein